MLKRFGKTEMESYSMEKLKTIQETAGMFFIFLLPLPLIVSGHSILNLLTSLTTGGSATTFTLIAGSVSTAVTIIGAYALIVSSRAEALWKIKNNHASS